MFYTGLCLSKFNDGKLLLDRRFIKFGGDTNRNLELDQLVVTTSLEVMEFLNPIQLPKSRIGKKMARLLKDAVLSDGESFKGRKIDFNVTLDAHFPPSNTLTHVKRCDTS